MMSHCFAKTYFRLETIGQMALEENKTHPGGVKTNQEGDSQKIKFGYWRGGSNG